MLSGRPGSSHLGVCHLSKVLMVIVPQRRISPQVHLGKGYLSCTIEYPHLASGLGNLDAVADEDGPAVDAQDAGVESEDQSAPSVGGLFRSKAELWKKSERRSEQAGSRPRARNDAGAPSRSLRTVIPAKQRDLHRKVLVRAQADRYSHVRFHQWFQSMKRRKSDGILVRNGARFSIS